MKSLKSCFMPKTVNRRYVENVLWYSRSNQEKCANFGLEQFCITIRSKQREGEGGLRILISRLAVGEIKYFFFLLTESWGIKYFKCLLIFYFYLQCATELANKFDYFKKLSMCQYRPLPHLNSLLLQECLIIICAGQAPLASPRPL